MEITQRTHDAINKSIDHQIDLIPYYKMWSKRMKYLQYIREEQDMVLGMVASGVDQTIQTLYESTEGKGVPLELQRAIVRHLYDRMHEIKDKFTEL